MKNDPASFVEKALKLLNKYKFVLLFILFAFILQRVVLKIAGIRPGELKPGMNFIEPKRTAHRDAFDLNIDISNGFAYIMGQGGNRQNLGMSMGIMNWKVVRKSY